MKSGVEPIATIGENVRERRQALGLSIRQLAERAELSPSYVSAIELGKNPSTGRPTAPSKRVIESLSRALGVRLADTAELTTEPACGHAGHDHTLVYVLGGRRTDVLPQLKGLYGDKVDHWVYVSDPRTSPSSGQQDDDEADTTRITWPFGSQVYPDEFLIPDRIPAALSEELDRNRSTLEDKNVGFVIGDCSAVMRWVVNPETEVEYEAVWPNKVCSSFDTVLGSSPAANVCVYNHSDIEPIANRIDLLRTVIDLIDTHKSIVAIGSDNQIEVGGRAASAILSQVRPSSVSVNAWDALVSAYARSWSVGAEREPHCD